MSCQGTWADVIIIQAVANCFNLSAHIAESNPNFFLVTFVEPMHVKDGLNIYIGHLYEIYHVSTVQNVEVVRQEPKTCQGKTTTCCFKQVNHMLLHANIQRLFLNPDLRFLAVFAAKK